MGFFENLRDRLARFPCGGRVRIGMFLESSSGTGTGTKCAVNRKSHFSLK
jgi:hypothetical protein